MESTIGETFERLYVYFDLSVLILSQAVLTFYVCSFPNTYKAKNYTGLDDCFKNYFQQNKAVEGDKQSETPCSLLQSHCNVYWTIYDPSLPFSVPNSNHAGWPKTQPASIESGSGVKWCSQRDSQASSGTYYLSPSA